MATGLAQGARQRFGGFLHHGVASWNASRPSLCKGRDLKKAFQNPFQGVFSNRNWFRACLTQTGPKPSFGFAHGSGVRMLTPFATRKVLRARDRYLAWSTKSIRRSATHGCAGARWEVETRVLCGGFEVDSGVDSRWIAGGLRWIQVDSRGFGWAKGRRD